jgi:hypothetical protein
LEFQNITLKVFQKKCTCSKNVMSVRVCINGHRTSLLLKAINSHRTSLLLKAINSHRTSLLLKAITRYVNILFFAWSLHQVLIPGDLYTKVINYITPHQAALLKSFCQQITCNNGTYAYSCVQRSCTKFIMQTVCSRNER